jgi:hypothetical protein
LLKEYMKLLLNYNSNKLRVINLQNKKEVPLKTTPKIFIKKILDITNEFV